jgi:hypothetical protein
MNKIAIAAFTLSLAVTGGVALAAVDNGGITTSTDPAKIAAIEQHAKELQARGHQTAPAKPVAHSTAKQPAHKAQAKHQAAPSKKHQTQAKPHAAAGATPHAQAKPHAAPSAKQ